MSEGKRILVVDDTKETAELISFVLMRNGYGVETAADGKQCLEKVTSFRPDLIILDIMMPEIHGFDVLKKLKEDTQIQNQNIGVIVCSAKSYKPDIDLAKQLGAIAFIDKPFKKEDLLNKVNEFFNHK